MKKNLSQRGLILVLILYLILAITYSIVVPIGRGADEWAHYWYAQFIAQNGRLPTNPTERETAGYKSDWPPLYHLFAAGLTGWIGTDGPPTFKYRADNIRRQLIPVQGSEAILHTEDELFPWRQEILVWHIGRFLSIGFSLGTLLVTYLITLEIFTDSRGASLRLRERHFLYGSATSFTGTGSNKSPNPPISPSPILHSPPPYRLPVSPHFPAVAAVALLAFNPRFLFTGMLFNYDSLTLVLTSIFLWLGIRVAKGYHPRWGFWGLGALAGLALVTKYLTALLPLEILLFAFISLSNRQNKKVVANETQHHASRITYHVLRITRPLLIRLGQAALAFLFVTSWWFSYLLIDFNEIDTYGPVLGTIAPLLRGDSSDRTVEEMFAWLSGGQAPSPAYIEKQSRTLWQIMAELPTTFWGNPVTRPYPLNWFIWVISLIVIMAAAGLGLFWWAVRGNRLWINLLALHCALPVPFMLIRLFGARDVLEAVQGRHILFLSGPAVGILLMLGLWATSRVFSNVSRVFPYLLRLAPYLSRLIFTGALGLLLTGTVGQLIFMIDIYGEPLPVKTTPYPVVANPPVSPITLEGGATLIDYRLVKLEQALQVTLIWQGGDDFAPEDYQVELQLVNDIKQAKAGWLAYQTQAHYPTRAWEPGDVVREVGWLPLTGLAAGDYEIQLRILDQHGPVTDWQTLTLYTLGQMIGLYDPDVTWTLWRNGQPLHRPAIFSERQTTQFTIHNSQFTIHNYQLVGPDNMPHQPASTGPNWVNFIIEPDWPPGSYRFDKKGPVVLQVASNHRNFQLPYQPNQPLEANFAGQVKLLGYTLPSRRVQPGDGLPITLYWQGLQWMGEDFVIFDRLLDNQQVVWGGYDRLPKENYSTLLWAPDEVIADGFAVPVDPNAPDGVYTLNVGLYRQVNGGAESLLILNPKTGRPTDVSSVAIGPIKVGGPPPAVTVTKITPQTKVNVVLGEKIKLLGFDLLNERPGEDAISQLPITLYWQPLTNLDTDYTVFAHLRNTAGETVAQKDNPPANGAYPTGLWDAGEIIKDDLIIPLEQLKPGRYALVVGLYDFVTGIRLPVNGSPDDTILLQSFEVLAE